MGSILRKFTIQLAYVCRKKQVPFRAQEASSSGTDDEQLDSVTRHHIINELRRTTGATSKNNGINNAIGKSVISRISVMSIAP